MKEFFNKLFEYTSGTIEVRCLPSTKRRFFPLDKKEQLEAFVMQNIGQNIIFSVSTRNGGGKKEHIIHIPACWVDLDNTSRETMEQKLKGFPLKPSFIVGSGGGYHVYWKFKEPYTLAEAEQIEALNHSLAHVFGADHNACDVSRVLRVPGTFNYKYHPKREVKLIQQNVAEYMIDDFEFLPPWEKKIKSHAKDFLEKSTKEIEAIMACKFMAYCKENARNLPEPAWYAMITQLVRIPSGRNYIHTLSKPYPHYSIKETDDKILHVINDSGPLTCGRIKQIWDCGNNCGVKSPAALRFKNREAIDLPQDKSLFPKFVMEGIAGAFANLYSSYLEPPKEFFFFSFLTCLGSILANRLTLSSEIRPQPRLYTLILGESADDRKSTAISKTIEFFKDIIQDFSLCYGVGSAEGLQERIIDCSPQGLLLVFDEMKAFVSKCKIEASVLLPCVNTLFESNRYQSRTKKTDILLENAYLSILAASTIQTYENMWSTQFTDIGFYNRIFIVPGSGERKHSIPKIIPLEDKELLRKRLSERLQLILEFTEYEITPEARDLFDDWYFNLERSIHTKRIDTYAHRLMPLLAINEGKLEVDEYVMKKVIYLMNWQLEVRKRYDPIDADNKVAKMENKIRSTLNSRPMSNRGLKRSCHYERYGLWLFGTALKNLQSAGEVLFDKKTQTWRMR